MTRQALLGLTLEDYEVHRYMRDSEVYDEVVTTLSSTSGHVFVLVGSNPTVVTNVKPVPSPEADDVAVTSSQSLMPCRDR